jgi:putative ABC transport system substrate-binding protein
MRRREFITILGGAVLWPVVGRAQSTNDVRRVGILWPGASPPASPRLESFREGLREAGFIEGENLAIELRYSKTGLQHLPELAAELVRRKVEVIEASGDFAPRVAQQATSTIPIVAFTDDVLGAGLVDSLSRPGRNTTGLTILAPELSAKRLEILSEIVPGLSRVAALWDPTSSKSQVAMTETAASAMKIQLQILEVRHRDQLVDAFAAAKEGKAQAINQLASPILASMTREFVRLAAEYRLPTIYQWGDQVEAGGLVSYGPNLALLWRQAGNLVAKLLKGAKSGDLPVEQPTKFELVINLKTAKTLNLAVPRGLLDRADQVIE